MRDMPIAAEEITFGRPLTGLQIAWLVDGAAQEGGGRTIIDLRWFNGQIFGIGDQPTLVRVIPTVMPQPDIEDMPFFRPQALYGKLAIINFNWDADRRNDHTYQPQIIERVRTYSALLRTLADYWLPRGVQSFSLEPNSGVSMVGGNYEMR